MTVRVNRTFHFDASPDRVWDFIADPAKRAAAISVVADFEIDPDDGRKATWHIKLPVVNSTTPVQTEDVDVDPPRYVKFEGRSRVMRVFGEHTVEEASNGCRLRNEFVVEGRLPGVERYFKRNLDRELDNLERALREELELAV